MSGHGTVPVIRILRAQALELRAQCGAFLALKQWFYGGCCHIQSLPQSASIQCNLIVCLTRWGAAVTDLALGRRCEAAIGLEKSFANLTSIQRLWAALALLRNRKALKNPGLMTVEPETAALTKCLTIKKNPGYRPFVQPACPGF